MFENEQQREEFDRAVDAVYDWVDAEVQAASPRCEISGRCCKFREYGHRLYITAVESERLQQAELPEDRRDWTAEQVRQQCPYQVQGRCTAREHRPLGCRIYFCDPSFDEKSCEITEEALNRLKRIYEEFDQPWIYQDLASYLGRDSAE